MITVDLMYREAKLLSKGDCRMVEWPPLLLTFKGSLYEGFEVKAVGLAWGWMGSKSLRGEGRRTTQPCFLPTGTIS